MPDHAFVTAPPVTAPPVTTPSEAAPSPRPTAVLQDAAVPSTQPRTSTAAGAGGVISVRAWSDPAAERVGYDPRSRYVERFWLGVLGPSATWLLRRLSDELGRSGDDDVVSVDLVALAQQMGMSYVPGRNSPFARAIQRCVMFGIAHHTGDGLAVRRRIPQVAERHLQRLPPSVAREHDRWTARQSPPDEFRRAHRLGLAMVDVGDCVDQIEAQLGALGVADDVAGRVVDELSRPTGDASG